MTTPREIELKLECDVPDLAALAAHPKLKGRGRSKTNLLDTAYYDTVDRDLRDAGLSLRLRNGNGSPIQTLKASAHSAGMFDRPEWEWTVAGPLPDPELLAETPAAAILANANRPQLELQFRTVVERSTRIVKVGGSTITVTLDAGRVETEKGDAPLCELELELKAGSPADLFALTRTLSETVPLRLGALSKGERGYALSDETLRRPSKAQTPSLEEGISTGDAFVRLAQGCLKQLRLNEEVFLYNRDHEALHQMRVALRRLRSLLTLFKPMLGADEEAQRLRDEIKRVTEPFGTARNLDVYLSETLAPELARRPDEPGLPVLREHLAAEQRQAQEAVHDILVGPAWRALLLDLVTWIEVGAWRTQDALPHRDRPVREFAAEVLERFRRRVKKRGHHLTRLDPETRHEVRIDAKKLRYGAEFFGSLFPDKKSRKRYKAFVAALSDLQDHLGALNDLATAHEIAKRLTTPDDGANTTSGAAIFAAGLTTANAETRAENLLAQADDVHDDLVDVRPFWR